MPHMRTADAVIESLIRHGIDTLYALPGVHNDHLFDAAFRAAEKFRVIHPRHEQAAAYMALGAALVTGKPQAFAVVPGPGILNASAALLTGKFLISSPLTLLMLPVTSRFRCVPYPTTTASCKPVTFGRSWIATCPPLTGTTCAL